SAPDTRPA
nr:Chain P, Mucin 1, Transmembrane [synthetic construct]